MRKLTRQELKEILEDHLKWLNNGCGTRADLHDADLHDADLCSANLCGADLCGADLCSANLCGADLHDANLRNANLWGANLRNANLCGADLCSANLCGADLCGANLRNANLCGADLCSANLCGANLNERTSFFAVQCPEEGSFIAWKKCYGDTIVKLLIPENAKRSSATTRKCRSDKAFVLNIFDSEGNEIEKTVSNFDNSFEYIKNKEVLVEDYDENRWKECSTGIHFFITRREAECY